MRFIKTIIFHILLFQINTYGQTRVDSVLDGMYIQEMNLISGKYELRNPGPVTVQLINSTGFDIDSVLFYNIYIPKLEKDSATDFFKIRNYKKSDFVHGSIPNIKIDNHNWVMHCRGVPYNYENRTLIIEIVLVNSRTSEGKMRLETRIKPSYEEEIREDFKKYFDQFNVQGSFVLFDQNNDKFIFYNKDQFNQGYTPASTFKICNSLIGLETGVIKDENFIIHWDSIMRNNPNWNKDHDLKTAFKNSTVWYYQELARRVGEQQMKLWLNKSNYGNTDLSGGIDKFWLSGGLRISPQQQIDFLKRLHDNKLPFSQRSMDIVKEIMISKDTLDYVVRAKSGWGGHDNKDIGWYVGYLETKDNVYYFANCLQSVEGNKDFVNARIEIVYSILEDLKIITK